MHWFVIIFLLFSASAIAGSGSTVPFDGTTKDGDEYQASFCWESGKKQFDLMADGTGTMTTQGARPASSSLRLPVQDGEYIERLWFKAFRGDSLILFEASEGGHSRGALCRYRHEPWEMRWCRWIPAFNLVAAISKDQTVYVGGIGFLARLNPNSGKFMWRRKGLYQTDRAFNIFGVPSESDTLVKFEATAGAGPVPDKVISLERTTGRIVSIELNKAGREGVERSNIGLPRTLGNCASPGR